MQTVNDIMPPSHEGNVRAEAMLDGGYYRVKCPHIQGTKQKTEKLPQTGKVLPREHMSQLEGE